MQLPMQMFPALLVAASTLAALAMACEWRKTRQEALLWWGASCFLAALGESLVTLSGILPDLLSGGVATALMLAGYGMTSQGTCRLVGRQAVPLVWTSPFVWLFLWIADWSGTALQSTETERLFVAFLLVAAHGVLSYRLCLSLPGEGIGRKRLAAVFLVHTLLYEARAAMLILAPAPVGEGAGQGAGALLFLVGESVLFPLLIAALLLALARERRGPIPVARAVTVLGYGTRIIEIGQVTRNAARDRLPAPLSKRRVKASVGR